METSKQPAQPKMGTEIGKEAGTFTVGLAKEGERSAVVLGAARLDVSLEHLLKAILCHNPGGDDNLFDVERPIGSFSAKTALAYRLGLIDPEMEHALQMVRKIRNSFAHSTDVATLANSPHKDRVEELAKAATKSSHWLGLNDQVEKLISNPTLAKFATAVTVMLIIIETIATLSEHSHPRVVASFSLNP